MTDSISGSNIGVGSVECKIIKVSTRHRNTDFASIFNPKSLAFISIIVDNMEETYFSNSDPYSSEIDFNFSETIHFNFESIILFSFYRQLNSESSIFVASISVKAQTLIKNFYNSLTTSIEKRLEMFPINPSNSNSDYFNIVIEFSDFISPNFSENLSPSNNMSNRSIIDSTREERTADLHTTTQQSINRATNNPYHNQFSQLLSHEWEQRIDEQGWEYYVYYNNCKTKCQRPDRINSMMYRMFSLAFNTFWKVTSKNYNNNILYKNLNIEAGTNIQAHQIWKGPEITIIDQYFGFIPEGWEMRLDNATNLIYFMDHIAKKTLDYDPRFQNLFNIGCLLPENWEIRVLLGQLPFFVYRNSSKNRTNIDPRVGLDSYASGGSFIKCIGNTRNKNLLFQELCTMATKDTKIRFTISRKNIMEDSLGKIMGEMTTNFHNRLFIYFYGEEGIDNGGIAREWFYQITKEICNPVHNLFKACTSGNYYIKINPNSSMKPNHLLYFRFVGRILAMALFHGYLIYGGFDNNFYKRILGRRLTMEDLKMTDIDIYNSLKWICENDIEKEELELYFCTESDLFGTMIVTELIPGGTNVRVTQLNKFDYVNLITEWTLSANISEQMNAIKTAFFEIIPWPWVAFFDEKELELLLCGIKSYDIHDWKNNTEYGGGYCYESKQIKWFWTLVESFESEQIARLIQLATGTSRVPFTGFCDLNGANGPQKFKIGMWGDTTHLPQSHTCSNQIELPPYPTFNDLKSKLLTAIEESSGFHLV